MSLSCAKVVERGSDFTESTHRRKASLSPTAPSSLSRTFATTRKSESRPRGQDRYQRTIADVMLPDGRILNYEIVKAGFAWWFRRYAPERPNIGRAGIPS